MFHYTDASAVRSILETRSLRLTDLRFLNDSTEMQDGLSWFERALKNPNGGLWANFEHEQATIAYLQKAFNDQVSFGIAEDPIFVASFCKAPDLLSQWRAYGSYAIEFDPDAMKRSNHQIEGCVYADEEKKQRALKLVTNAVITVSNEMGETETRSAGLNSLNALESIISASATFKNKGFSEEQELRIVRATEDDESLCFREHGGSLVPYLEEAFSPYHIKSIWVGPSPNQELSAEAMRTFVDREVRKWREEFADIEIDVPVSCSSIPFRSA